MKKEKLQQSQHLLAGLITLVYGFDSFESGEFLSATYYLGLAIVFLLVAGTHKWIVEKFMSADVAFLLMEGITMIYAGWGYNNNGHKIIYFLLSGTGCVYLVFAIIAMSQKDKPKHKSSRRRRKRRKRLDDPYKTTRPSQNGGEPTKE